MCNFSSISVLYLIMLFKWRALQTSFAAIRYGIFVLLLTVARIGIFATMYVYAMTGIINIMRYVSMEAIKQFVRGNLL